MGTSVRNLGLGEVLRMDPNVQRLQDQGFLIRFLHHGLTRRGHCNDASVALVHKTKRAQKFGFTATTKRYSSLRGPNLESPGACSEHKGAGLSSSIPLDLLDQTQILNSANLKLFPGPVSNSAARRCSTDLCIHNSFARHGLLGNRTAQKPKAMRGYIELELRVLGCRLKRFGFRAEPCLARKPSTS